jgi:hypothetical protein
MLPAVLIIKDNRQTQFMQACGVFEPYKFVGRQFDVKIKDDFVLADLLGKLIEVDDDKDFTIVGLIVPHRGAMFKPDHKIYSDHRGLGWVTIELLAESFGCNSVNIYEPQPNV